jgi:hypothetical protein
MLHDDEYYWLLSMLIIDTCYANQKLTIVMIDACINPSKRVILFLQNVLLFSFITEFFPFVFSAASVLFGEPSKSELESPSSLLLESYW